MSLNSVEHWLNSLRFEPECYDQFSVKKEEKMELLENQHEEEEYINIWDCHNIYKSTPNTSNSNLNDDSVYSSAEENFFDCISKTNESVSTFEDTLSNFEESSVILQNFKDENLEERSGFSFEGEDMILSNFCEMEDEEVDFSNILEEDSILLRKIGINFGRICRISEDFSEEIQEFNVTPIKIENVALGGLSDSVKLWKSDIRYLTNEEESAILECQELLKSFSQTSSEKYEPPIQNKFPTEEIEDEDDVQIRRDASAQSIRRYRSKTVDYTTEKDAVDISNVHGYQHDKICTKFNPYEVLRFQNGSFYKVQGTKKELLMLNVKSITQTSKKEAVEIRDVKNNVHCITFKKASDCKIFTTNEKIQKYVTESKVSVGIRLRWLLGRRSTREVLENKGIYRNEPIFGNTLQEIYQKNGHEVPKFVQRTIQLIERPENIKSVGLYRTSGNLATIQKIRLEVDNGKIGILEQYSRDVDVLTGCLKMFFRELKEPLITCETCEKLLEIAKSSQTQVSKKDRDKIKSILTKELHEGNLETLFLIIRHLINVVKHKELNKMDSYNLAVCWGPSAIFSLTVDSCKDIVAQSHDATRLLDFFINYFKDNPEEMDVGNKTNIQRQVSEETFKSSSSSISFMVDEVIKKIVEIIEKDIQSEGLYKKSGSVEKCSKIMKKMNKKKYNELEKCKGDINDFTDAFKKHLRDSPTFVNKENVESILSVCDINACLEHTNRQKIQTIVEDFHRKDTFIFILKHIIKVIYSESFHRVSRNDIIDIWTNVMNYQEKVCGNEKFGAFLKILLEVFDESKQNVRSRHFGQNLKMSDVIKDVVKLQKENDRFSKYDNVPEKGEACFLDDDNNNFKTEETKL